MNGNSFYLKVGSAVLLSVAAASILTTSTRYAGIVAGLAGLSALLAIKSAVKTGRKTGRTERMKVSLVTAGIMVELLLLLGAFSNPIIPKYAAAITLAAIAFYEILDLEVRQEIKKNYTPDIGRNGRIVALAGALAAYEVNVYYLFYGTLFVFLLAVYDSLRLIHRLSREL